MCLCRSLIRWVEARAAGQQAFQGSTMTLFMHAARCVRVRTIHTFCFSERGNMCKCELARHGGRAEDVLGVIADHQESSQKKCAAARNHVMVHHVQHSDYNMNGLFVVGLMPMLELCRRPDLTNGATGCCGPVYRINM